MPGCMLEAAAKNYVLLRIDFTGGTEQKLPSTGMERFCATNSLEIRTGYGPLADIFTRKAGLTLTKPSILFYQLVHPGTFALSINGTD